MAKIQMSEVQPELLREAQRRHGYSDRDMATRLHLGTEKTWWRWRTSGQIPTTSLPAVAIVLELPELLDGFNQPGRHHDGDGAGGPELSQLAGEVASVRQQLAEILTFLRERDERASSR